MFYKPLFVGAALALIVSPALAQTAQTMGAQSMAPAERPAGATKTDPSAATGTAVNTSGVVEMADLKTGALVRDPSGAEVGSISKVTPGLNGEAATVTLSHGGKTTSTSAALLTTKGQALYTTKTKAEIWSAGKAPR